MLKRYNSQKVLKRDRRCVYCGSSEHLTTDHVIPISRRHDYGLSGGEINNYGNLVAACRKCNCKKSARTPEEFFQKHPEYEQNFIRNSRYISDRVLSALGLNR